MTARNHMVPVWIRVGDGPETRAGMVLVDLDAGTSDTSDLGSYAIARATIGALRRAADQAEANLAEEARARIRDVPLVIPITAEEAAAIDDRTDPDLRE